MNHLNNRFHVPLLLALSSVPVVEAQIPSLTAKEAVGPVVRSAVATAYDASREETLLFGGVRPFDVPPGNPQDVVGDTWVYRDETWRLLHPLSSPVGRYGATMAYVPTTEDVLLFGGRDQNGNYLNDTWLWNGASWTRWTGQVSPSPRAGMSLAWDPVNQRVIGYGGAAPGPLFPAALADTWSWDPASGWRQLFPATQPNPNRGAAVFTLPGKPYVYMTGGGILNGDTVWRWDGTDWALHGQNLSPHSIDVGDSNSVVQDGVLYAYDSTARNLMSYDGTAWSVYRLPPRSLILNSFVVRSDRPGRILVQQEEAHIFDRNTNSWIPKGDGWREHELGLRAHLSRFPPLGDGFLIVNQASSWFTDVYVFHAYSNEFERLGPGPNLWVGDRPGDYHEDSGLYVIHWANKTRTPGVFEPPDTWFFDGSQWTRVRYPVAPAFDQSPSSGRLHRWSRMVYDPDGRRHLYLDEQRELWEWMPATGWRMLGTAPVRLSRGTQLYYDRDRHCLFFAQGNSMHEWRPASGWRSIPFTIPPAGRGGLVTYLRGVGPIYTGGTGLPNAAITYVWDGATWNQIATDGDGISGRVVSTMSDPAREQVLIMYPEGYGSRMRIVRDRWLDVQNTTATLGSTVTWRARAALDGTGQSWLWYLSFGRLRGFDLKPLTGTSLWVLGDGDPLFLASLQAAGPIPIGQTLSVPIPTDPTLQGLRLFTGGLLFDNARIVHTSDATPIDIR